MKNEELKNVQNQEEEILNSQEGEVIEGGVKKVTDLESIKNDDQDSNLGCDCVC